MGDGFGLTVDWRGKYGLFREGQDTLAQSKARAKDLNAVGIRRVQIAAHSMTARLLFSRDDSGKLVPETRSEADHFATRYNSLRDQAPNGAKERVRRTLFVHTEEAPGVRSVQLRVASDVELTRIAGRLAEAGSLPRNWRLRADFVRTVEAASMVDARRLLTIGTTVPITAIGYQTDRDAVLLDLKNPAWYERFLPRAMRPSERALI